MSYGPEYESVQDTRDKLRQRREVIAKKTRGVCVYVCACAYVCMWCVYLCVCVMCIFVCVCVVYIFVCVCGVYIRVCVCVVQLEGVYQM